jgi:hypothetical protein
LTNKEKKNKNKTKQNKKKKQKKMHSELAFQFQRGCKVEAAQDAEEEYGINVAMPPVSSSSSSSSSFASSSSSSSASYFSMRNGEKNSGLDWGQKGMSDKKMKEETGVPKFPGPPKVEKTGCPVVATLHFVGAKTVAEKENKKFGFFGQVATDVQGKNGKKMQGSRRPSINNLLPSVFPRNHFSSVRHQGSSSSSKFSIFFVDERSGLEPERTVVANLAREDPTDGPGFLRVEDVSREVSVQRYLLLAGLQQTPVQGTVEGVTVLTRSGSAGVPLLLASVRDAAEKRSSGQLFRTDCCRCFVQAADVFWQECRRRNGTTAGLREQPWLCFDSALTALHKKPKHLQRQRTKVVLALAASFLTTFLQERTSLSAVYFEELKRGDVHISCSGPGPEEHQRNFLSEMYLVLKKNRFQAELVPGTRLCVPLPSGGTQRHEDWIGTIPFLLL